MQRQRLHAIQTTLQSSKLATIAKLNEGKVAMVTGSRQEQAKLTALRIGQGAMKAAIAAKVNEAKTGIVAGGHQDRNALAAIIRASRAVVSVVTNVSVSGGNSYQTSQFVNTAKLKNLESKV